MLIDKLIVSGADQNQQDPSGLTAYSMGTTLPNGSPKE
jgi:hypothetical protein